MCLFLTVQLLRLTCPCWVTFHSFYFPCVPFLSAAHAVFELWLFRWQELKVYPYAGHFLGSCLYLHLPQSACGLSLFDCACSFSFLPFACCLCIFWTGALFRLRWVWLTSLPLQMSTAICSIKSDSLSSLLLIWSFVIPHTTLSLISDSVKSLNSGLLPYFSDYWHALMDTVFPCTCVKNRCLWYVKLFQGLW